LFAACVVGWDEEAFELPFTKENVIATFSKTENQWMVLNIVPFIREATNFFH